jgi:hypothetical protein
MADLIGLINDISTSVKLAWIGVLAWGAVQFVWYQRARVLPGTAEGSSSRSSSEYQFPSVTRPHETDSIEIPAPQVPGMAAAVDLDVLEVAELPSESDMLAEFQEPGTPRRRSIRRRRSTASSEANAVPDFALDAPKAT